MKRKAIIIIGWLVLWQIIALIIHNNILIASPIDVIVAFFNLIKIPSFWLTILISSLRIFIGIIIGALIGIIIAWFAYRYELIKDIFQPFFSILKAIPVVSFIVLLLIWFGAKGISLLVSMIIVMPIFYFNILEGLQHSDKSLLEMAKIYQMSQKRMIQTIYFPSVYPTLKSALLLSSGMGVKSGIAAEVIGQVRNTIGNEIYQSKIYLSTADLFAWTIVVLLIAWLFEKLLLFILKRWGNLE